MAHSSLFLQLVTSSQYKCSGAAGAPERECAARAGASVEQSRPRPSSAKPGRHRVDRTRVRPLDPGDALALVGERSLAAGDLLSATPPAVAVLSGCETGLPDPRAHAGGMSLAQALLLAGASAVIATDATVDDGLAAALTPARIAALADGVDPGEALRQAQRAQIGRGDWARFRALVP